MKTRSLRKIQLLQALFSVGALVACGGYSSNPTSKYNIPTVAPHERKPLPSQGILTSPFQFEVVGAAQALGRGQAQLANFVEGKTKSVQIKVLTSPVVKSFSLNPSYLPNDANGAKAEFQRSSSDPSLFTLQWTPPFGTADTDFEITLVAVVTAANDPRTKTNVAADDSMTLKVKVQKTELQPEILSYSELKDGAWEGEKHPFTITVKDPIGGSTPITIEPKGNQRVSSERLQRNGASYFVPNELRPPVNSGGIWTFFYVLDLESAPLPLPRDKNGKLISNATSIELCFFIVAEKKGFESSSPRSVCVLARYATQIPQLELDPELTVFKAKETKSLSFNVTTPNNMGSIAVENVTPGFSTWPGNPKLECQAEAEGRANQKCVLTWTPSCASNRLGYSRDLRLKANNSVPGKKGKDVVFPAVRLKVESSPEACPAAPAPKTKATTPQGGSK